jgi:hypothetical protein
VTCSNELERIGAELLENKDSPTGCKMTVKEAVLRKGIADALSGKRYAIQLLFDRWWPAPRELPPPAEASRDGLFSVFVSVLQRLGDPELIDRAHFERFSEPRPGSQPEMLAMLEAKRQALIAEGKRESSLTNDRTDNHEVE